MQESVQNLLKQYIGIWESLDNSLPIFERTFTTRDQAPREAKLTVFLNSLTTELNFPPHTRSERQSAQERIYSAFSSFAKSALDFTDLHLDVLHGFIQIASDFSQMARSFDAKISGSDIFQATRNVWTMNGLQRLLGLSVALTPAVFAYSMLYPYTDNYLDDPKISKASKTDFNQRFTQRLKGEMVAPINDHERRIYDLIGMIEGQFQRTTYPKVFESLLAIHHAQERSVELIHHNSPLDNIDVLGISLEKGGTSVLADGYLVAESLTEPQSDAMFGYGAFLQLADDLQDVQKDSKDGLLTIFSQTANHKPLDELTNRTYNFGTQVLKRLNCFDAPGIEPLKELMRRSADRLIVEGVGSSNGHFTKGYRRRLESHSPFRFSVLQKHRKKLSRQRVSLIKLIEAFAIAEDKD